MRAPLPTCFQFHPSSEDGSLLERSFHWWPCGPQQELTFIKPNLGLLLMGSALGGGHPRPSCHTGAQPGDLPLLSPATVSSPFGPVPGGAVLGTDSDASIGSCDPDPSAPDLCLLPISIFASSLKTSPRFHRKQKPHSLHTITCPRHSRLPPLWKRKGQMR